jgi:hypothetical protein
VAIREQVQRHAQTSMTSACAIAAVCALLPFVAVLALTAHIARTGPVLLSVLLALTTIMAAATIGLRALVADLPDSQLWDAEVPDGAVVAGFGLAIAGLFMGLAALPATGFTLAVVGLTAAVTPVGLWAAAPIPLHAFVASLPPSTAPDTGPPPRPGRSSSP